MTIYARSNFTFKSPAGIKIHTYSTSLNGPLGAIRVMFSLLWRAPSTCHLSPSWSLSCTSSTFALKHQWGSNFAHRNAPYCVLAPVGSLFHFLCQRDLEGAQDTFLEKCENVRKIKGNSSKRCVYELLKHRNIQNQPRIISKTDTLDFTQFDLLPRAPD